MSKRIAAIAEFIHPYKSVADIGCDHGYLLDIAFQKGVTLAQAIDNKTGPLEIAINNLKKHGDKVIFSLSDGLSDLDPRIEVIVIAGMGGSLITKILSENKHKLENVKRVILQANRNIDKVRQYAINNGFKLVSEKIIEEESIIYEIIVLEKGYQELNEAEIIFGPFLLKNKHPLFIKKWQYLLDHYKVLNRKEHLKIIDMINKNVFDS